MDALERFRLWLEARELSQTAAGHLLGVSGQMLSMILGGKRTPGRRLANAIEEHSAGWEHGPIASTEWDALEDARKREAASPTTDPVSDDAAA